VLADEALLDAVMQELARRRPQSRRRGTAWHPGRGGATYAGAQAPQGLELRRD
jgi:hypothetical protein